MLLLQPFDNGVEAYQAGWLKRYHPAEFMAAVLSNGKGFYSTLVYALECYHLGHTFALINSGSPEHTCPHQQANVSKDGCFLHPILPHVSTADSKNRRLKNGWNGNQTCLASPFRVEKGCQNDATFLYLKAQCHAALGNLDVAKESLEKTFGINPEMRLSALEDAAFEGLW